MLFLTMIIDINNLTFSAIWSRWQGTHPGITQRSISLRALLFCSYQDFNTMIVTYSTTATLSRHMRTLAAIWWTKLPQNDFFHWMFSITDENSWWDGVLYQGQTLSRSSEQLSQQWRFGKHIVEFGTGWIYTACRAKRPEQAEDTVWIKQSISKIP